MKTLLTEPRFIDTLYGCSAFWTSGNGDGDGSELSVREEFKERLPTTFRIYRQEAQVLGNMIDTKRLFFVHG